MPNPHQVDGATTLADGSSRDRLQALSELVFVESFTVTSAEEARREAERLNGRVVLKVDSDQVLHKSELGLVKVALPSSEVVEAYSSLEQAAEAAGLVDYRIILQPLASEGLDLFVGVSRDPALGPLIMVGLGGVTVELFGDVSRRLAPVAAVDVDLMINELKSAALLRGFRGSAAYSTKELAAVVEAVGDFALANPDLKELDLNPVRIYPDGRCLILDACSTWTDEVTSSPGPRPIRSLDSLFMPASVAVVGVSAQPSRPGAKLLRALQNSAYDGRISVVHPKGVAFDGVETFTSLSAMPVKPDLVCVALAADDAIDVVRECVGLGVPAVLLLASGFAELGAQGLAREEMLKKILADSETVLCGPNTIGFINADIGLVATFSQGMTQTTFSNSGVTMVAQSGAVAGSLVSRELARGYGIGTWVTTGNQVDLDVADYIHHLVGAPGTKSIALFLEGVSDGAKLREALSAARAAGIPVAAFKAGMTFEGGQAVSAHSGALAGSAEAYLALLREQAVVQVHDLSGLLETAWMLGHVQPPDGSVAVVTTSGGAGSAAVDAAVNAGLAVPSLPRDVATSLAQVLPSMAVASNPLDVTAEGAFQPGVMHGVLAALQADARSSVLTVVLTSIVGADGLRVAQEIADAAALGPKPVVVTWLVDQSLVGAALELLAHSGVRVFDDPARMMRAIRSAVTTSTKRTEP